MRVLLAGVTRELMTFCPLLKSHLVVVVVWGSRFAKP
jgi:hypothetical protein